MVNILRAIFLLLFLISVKADVSPLILEANVSEVFPTQMEVGMARIDRKIAKYYRKWQQAYPSEEKSFEEFVAHELVIKKRLPAILDPQGRIYILDGHHRSLTFVMILRNHPELLADAHFEVDVIGDYRGKTQKEFARGLIIDHGKGYFSPEIREQNLSPKKLVALLPKSVEGMTDNPMRSLIGEVFDRLDLETEWMADYIQFYLGEMVEDLALKLDQDDVLSESNIQKTTMAILTKKKLVNFLLDNPRSEELRAQNTKQIRDIINLILPKKDCKRILKSFFS